MIRLIISCLLIVLATMRAHAEVCLENDTIYDEAHFSFQYIPASELSIDRSTAKAPLITRPTQFKRVRLGQEDVICSSYYEMANKGLPGYLAVYLKPLGKDAAAYQPNHAVWLSKQPLTAGPDESVVFAVTQATSGKVIVKARRGQTPMAVPMEKVWVKGRTEE